MRLKIFLVLSVVFISCNGQSNKLKKIEYKSGLNLKSVDTVTHRSLSVDTLSQLSLKNSHYGNIKFKVLQLCDIDSSGYWIDTTRRIDLTKRQTVVASFRLPISDVDIVNFSVSKISETDSGFKIVVNWGRGNNLYGRSFYFVFVGSKFYFSKLERKVYNQDSQKEKKTTIKIVPPIPIENFDIFKYLNNE